MPVRVKNSQFTSRLVRPGNNRGQAIIEYTLVLIIVVSILLMVTSLVVKPFGMFISDYFGKYTACLLEYGELPTTGAQDPSVVDDDSECNKRFQKGTFTAGRPPNPTGSSGSESGKSNTSSNKSESSRSESGGTYAGSSSRGGGRGIATNRRASSGVESGRRQEGKIVEIAINSGGNNGFFRSSNNNSSYGGQGRRTMSVGLAGLTEAEKKKLERKADGTATTIATDSQLARPSKKTTVKPPPAPTFQDKSEPMTFGNFIRYLFIAALVIALVIFIGGQALQMSKSGEK